MKSKIRLFQTVIFAALMLNPGLAPAGTGRVKELAKLSIEELISIKVTSVLKTPRPLSESPAAVYVLTGEDIRRSGAANVPDLLRTVPGVQVAELDENIFAITIRGFNDIHANKLLVMIDGRSVYNHIFSGVIWSSLNVFMEDIERIEIIRGPGSSVWGANAVNGVINIITKQAGGTKGVFAEFGCGKPNTVSGGVRYGGALGDSTDFRLYAKGIESTNNHLSMPGFDSRTCLDSEFGGFRADWNSGDTDVFSLQGEVTRYAGETEEDNPQRPPGKAIVEMRSWHLLNQWKHTFSEKSGTVWQMYFHREERVTEYCFKTFDLDFQHDYEWNDRNLAGWGLGYRYTTDEMIRGLFGNYTYDPVESDRHLFSFFVQNTFQVVPDCLDIILGSKFEHNDYTGFEIQPSIRVSWIPHKRHSLWATVSRAVRTPSRIDSDATSKSRPSERPSEIRGDENFDSEDLIAYEIGWRMNPVDEFWLDTAVFYNVYDNLAAYERIRPGVWHIINGMEGENCGFELSAEYRPFEWWRFSATWSFLEIDMRMKAEQAGDQDKYQENTCPKHQFSLHSSTDIGKHLDFDVWLRHVDEVGHMRPSFTMDAPLGTAAGYAAIDARLAWRPTENLELSLTGRNIGGAHTEFSNHEVEESLFFRVKMEFGE